MDSKSAIWHLIVSRETSRLKVESEPGNNMMTRVLWRLFGLFTLATCIIILNVPPPLSPPTFSQISSSGMWSSCQVEAWTHWSYSSSKSLTRALRLVTATTGVSLISIPVSLEPCWRGNHSPVMLSLMALSWSFLTSLSLPVEILRSFSQLLRNIFRYCNVFLLYLITWARNEV